MKISSLLANQTTKLLVVVGTCAVAWFALAEAGTEAWYRYKESQMPKTSEWNLDLPNDGDQPSWTLRPFQEREMTDQEQELLRYDEALAANWVDRNHFRWTVFHIKWGGDKRLNDTDIAHNPLRCLPAVGLDLDRVLDPVEVRIAGVPVEFLAWKFKSGNQPVYVYIANRRERQPPALAYVQSSFRRGLLRLDKVADGNRTNPVELLQFIVQGPSTDGEAAAELRKCIERLSTRVGAELQTSE